MKIIGIDFGASKLALAYVNEQGQPEVIRNERGRTTTPALISFEGGELSVGELAWEYGQAGKRGIVRARKRSIDDPTFRFASAGQLYTTIDLAALLLKHLQALAQAYLKEAAPAAVLAIPSSFAHSQREALLEAARQAGFAQVYSVSEPVAAGLAYHFIARPQRRRALLYDLGGGSFSASLLEFDAGEVRLLASAGEVGPGGLEWHARLLAHALTQLAHAGIEPGEQELQELDFALTWTRQALSLLPQARLSKRFGSQVCVLTFTRSDFAGLTQDLLETTGAITQRLLWESRLSWDDLDEVLLMGGATRMPMVRDLLVRLGGKQPRTDLDPDTAIALGAALYGVSLQGSSQPPPQTDETSVRAVSGSQGYERQEARTLYFAVDLSGSMVDPQPIFEEVKDALLALLEQCDPARERVGLITFSDDAEVNLTATQDREALRQAIERLEIGQTGPGNNGHPFDKLKDALNGMSGARSVILLTDGAWARPEAARLAARRCQMDGILIYVYRLKSSVDGAYSDFLKSLASSSRQPFIVSMDDLYEFSSSPAREGDEDRAECIPSPPKTGE